MHTCGVRVRVEVGGAQEMVHLFVSAYACMFLCFRASVRGCSEGKERRRGLRGCCAEKLDEACVAPSVSIFDRAQILQTHAVRRRV